MDEISLKMDKKPREFVENMISEKLEDGQKRIDRSRKKEEAAAAVKEKSEDDLDILDDEVDPEDD